MKRVGLTAVALLFALNGIAARAQWEAPQWEVPATNDRLSPESMNELVKAPMTLLRTGGIAKAQEAFETLVAAAVNAHGRGSVEEADLLTSFGVSLYMEGLDRDDEKLQRAALPYLQRAIPAYKAAFGPRHPEVAVALSSYADVVLNLRDKALRPAAQSAVEEALSIRTEKLGADNPETLATTRRLTQIRDPESATMDDALTAAADVRKTDESSATATAELGTGELVIANDGDAGFWKPITYYNPLIDEFVGDVKGLAPGASAEKQGVAAKHGLSVAALDEGIALLRDMEKNAYNEGRRAGLRTRAIAWLKQSDRAPVALAFTGGILDHLTEDSCTKADFDLLMAGSRNRDADLWSMATSCTSSRSLAAAIDEAVRSKPALLYLATSWTRGDHASELAAVDMQLNPDFLSQIGPAERDLVHANIARTKLMKLIYSGLLQEAVRFGDGLDPAILKLALRPGGMGVRTTIGGFALKDSISGDSPTEDYAAALALAGRSADARAVLDLIAPLTKRKEARACLEAAKSDCQIGTRSDVPLGALIVDQLLDDPTGDPYVLMEAATQGLFSRYSGVTEALCRLLTQSDEAKECETTRKSAASVAESEALDEDDAAMWAAIRRAGGPSFEAARARYAAMLPPTLAKMKTTDWSRASIDPAPAPFRERPITPNLLAKGAMANRADGTIAALPKGFELIRRERSGRRVIAVSLSTRFDPNGEVSGGGYWVHISEDGGRSWGPPFYTGLAEHFPYVVASKSRLPLIAGDRIHLEVQESLIDTASISYPPVGLHVRRKRSGIYLDIPIAELSKDSDGDGLSDISARHLLLDSDSSQPTPFVVGRDRNCSPPNPLTLARLEILKKLFEVEARALIGIPDAKEIVGGWHRTQPSGKPPIFLRGNPDDWRCVVLDRPMVVYSEADQQRLRKFSPDFQLIELPPIRWNRAHTRGFVQWSTGWAGGTYRLSRNGEGWSLESISEWIT